MRFDGVWFRYVRRNDWALRAVDAVVPPGRTVVVGGRNGAGKSTLLQLAAGVLTPVRGAVRERPPIVGWVPERFPADQPFTAGEYLRRMAVVRGVDGPAALVGVWLDRLRMTEHRDTRLADLSKGTAQKVGLAQALLVRPGLLVLDEPWEGLDSVARALVPELVAEVTAAGGSVLVSDHRGEVAGLTDAIHWTVTEGALHVAAPRTGMPDDREQTAGAPDGGVSDGGLRDVRDVRDGGVHDGGVRDGGVHDGGGRDGGVGDGGAVALGGAFGGGEVIVEVAVAETDADATVARLRADGHRVVGVRR